MSARARFELPAGAWRPTSRPRRAASRATTCGCMVATRGDGRIAHAPLPRPARRSCAPGDLLVVNTSATAARRDRRAPRRTARAVERRASPRRAAPARRRLVGRRAAHGRRRGAAARRRGRAPRRSTAARRLELARARTRAARGCGSPRVRDGGAAGAPPRAATGGPIRYGYVPRAVAARGLPDRLRAASPGSAEMPSAGRPFTPELVTRLVAGGVLVAPVTLHAGVSSPERHEPPLPRALRGARGDGAARQRGARLGRPRDRRRHDRRARAGDAWPTPDGHVRAGRGLDRASSSRPSAGCAASTGCITGWHEPEASHLRLLEAAAGPELLARCYREALAARLPLARVRRQPPHPLSRGFGGRSSLRPDVRTAILIVSTSASRRSAPDEVGPALAAQVEEAGGEIVGIEVVPHDYALIEDRLHHFVEDDCGLVLTAGGIGADPDHVTPEATRAVIDRELPGVQEAIRAGDPELMLTRGIAGLAGVSLVVNLPGSLVGARRAFEVLTPLVRA